MKDTTAAIITIFSVASGIWFGLTFGQEGVMGLVVGGTAVWFSVGMALVGGFAAFGFSIVAWMAMDWVAEKTSR